MSRRALNVLELWPTVGYLHEFIGCQTKQSLVYDLQEPFRWIADVAVMGAFESGVLDLPDFYFTGDDYRYRFEPEAKQRFLDLLLERFNIGARYKGRVFKWDSVIEQKTTELGRYLAGKSATFDLSDPAPRLVRIDDQELRTLILSLSQSQAKRFEIGKSTLHYLCEKAHNPDSFSICQKTRRRLVQLRNRDRIGRQPT